MILKTLETFDGRKMKSHPRFSEKERNKDASILYISSINTRYSTCHSSEQLFIKDHPANNATYISVFSNIVKDNFRNDIPVNWFLPPNISIPDRLSSRVSDPRIAHSLFLIFVTNTHTQHESTRIDTSIIQRILFHFSIYLLQDIPLEWSSSKTLARPLHAAICRRYFQVEEPCYESRPVSRPPLIPRLSVLRANEILINFSPPLKESLYHGVNCQHIFIGGERGYCWILRETSFPRRIFPFFSLNFFFLFRGGEKKKESLRKILSDDGEASFLFFFDESPDSGSTVFRINFSFDLGRLVDNRDLICSLYIYTRI